MTPTQEQKALIEEDIDTLRELVRWVPTLQHFGEEPTEALNRLLALQSAIDGREGAGGTTDFDTWWATSEFKGNLYAGEKAMRAAFAAGQSASPPAGRRPGLESNLGLVPDDMDVPTIIRCLNAHAERMHEASNLRSLLERAAAALTAEPSDGWRPQE